MKYLVGNHKMNLISPVERDRYLAEFEKNFAKAKLKVTKIILCPALIHLESFSRSLKSKHVAFGTQDIFWEKTGSFTGEVSAWMVKNLKAEYALIGHSERRKYFGENSTIANLKIKAALKAGLFPIYCIGESLDERKGGETARVLSEQIKEGMQGIKNSELEKIIIAYEPVWSVGTDVFPTSNEVMEARIIIRKIIDSLFGAKNALKTKILYGGSVKRYNVKDLCLEPAMDGVLVGRESLKPDEFIKIAQEIDKSN